MPLALLNLGPSEVILILVLFLLLFGAQKVPDLARSLGKARMELEKAQREVREALTPDDERALREQLEFERLREHQIRQQVEDPEHAALAKAAEELGIAPAGRSKDELRTLIRERLDGAAAGASEA